MGEILVKEGAQSAMAAMFRCFQTSMEFEGSSEGICRKDKGDLPSSY